MPQPTQPQTRRGQAAGVAVGVGAGVGAAGAIAPPAVAAAGSVAAGVATAEIMASFITFLAELRRQHEAWLRGQLGAYGPPDDVGDVMRAEMVLEQEFAKNAADRMASSLPQALAIPDVKQREARVRQILADEQRYADQRAEAMAARAIAAMQRAKLRRVSPAGAFWRLGVAHKHTEGCKTMAGRFWPWPVLDRVHPPRHYGCTSSLHSYAEAIAARWMTPDDVPDLRTAIARSAGVMMEREAEGLLVELALRERLIAEGADERALAKIAWEGVEGGSEDR